MRLLLDTHALLWALDAPARLGEARVTIEDPRNEIFFSAASIWEIAIKAGLKRTDFLHSPDTILAGAVATGFVELPLRAAVTTRVAALPMYHRDPFDRLLVAQAMAEHIFLYTTDTQLKPYSELVHLI
jgi:PIN domain nuclease of toxin-antitoxin system